MTCDSQLVRTPLLVLHAEDSALQAADYVAINADFGNHDPTADRFVLEQASEAIGDRWESCRQKRGCASRFSVAINGTGSACSRYANTVRLASWRTFQGNDPPSSQRYSTASSKRCAISSGASGLAYR